MTALEDARDGLPPEAVISRDLLNFLIERSGGGDMITVSPGLLAQKLVMCVTALEARLLEVEGQLADRASES